MSPAPTDPESRLSLDALIAGLSVSSAYGAAEVPVEVVHTHISVVFLVGDRAYKIKKPVAYWSLVDYRAFDQRRFYCEEEVRLNRRLAPDVYLGVAAILRSEDGLRVGAVGADVAPADVVEHAVVMRRFDESDSLGARIARGVAGTAEVEAVARLLARFHADHRLPPEAVPADPQAAFLTVLDGNFGGTPVAGNALFDTTVHRALRARLRAEVAAEQGPASLLHARAQAGLYVDGHADIRLEHVLWIDGAFVVVDCVEFAPRLRAIDPAADIAFLGMDLRASGHPRLALVFETAYAEAAGERPTFATQLLPMFRSYRAYVRATVNFHTSQRPEVGPDKQTQKAAAAQRYLALAWTEARAHAPAVWIVMRGFSGTGKSRVARAIAPALRGEIFQSDAIRKELLGMAPTDRPQPEDRARVYGADMSARTYAELLARAGLAVDAGCRAVLLDATFLRRVDRDVIRAEAARRGGPCVVLELTCPGPVVRARIKARAARGDDASDADWAVHLMQRDQDEPLATDEGRVAVVHDTQAAPEAALMAVLACVETQGRDKE